MTWDNPATLNHQYIQLIMGYHVDEICTVYKLREGVVIFCGISNYRHTPSEVSSVLQDQVRDFVMIGQIIGRNALNSVHR